MYRVQSQQDASFQAEFGRLLEVVVQNLQLKVDVGDCAKVERVYGPIVDRSVGEFAGLALGEMAADGERNLPLCCLSPMTGGQFFPCVSLLSMIRLSLPTVSSSSAPSTCEWRTFRWKWIARSTFTYGLS